MALNINSFIQGAKNNFLFLRDMMFVQPQNTVINHVNVRPVIRQSQDIQKWRMALQIAEQDHEQRKQLYDLYSEIMLDGRLKSLVQQRIARITNTDITFKVDGSELPEIEALTETGFFTEFLTEALMSRFYGHSLLECYWPAPGQSGGVTNLIPREHVKPKRGIVTKNHWDTSGLLYRERPFSDYVIEVGKPTDLGMILEACPYVIYKRGGFGDWAEFAEVFGMPFRWATYNSEQSRGILESALSEAGSAGFVVAPEDAKLQFFNPTAGSASNDIFRFLVDQCNQELAITILGNTMTTQEAKNSGYAQSVTQMQTQDALHADDRKFILRVLNEKVTPYLERIGYKVNGGRWAFEDEDNLSLTQRIEIDMKVNSIVPIADKYWYEKYNLPMPDGTEAPDPEDDPKPKGKVGKKP